MSSWGPIVHLVAPPRCLLHFVVAFSSHFFCVEVQPSPQTAADEGSPADLLSSPGFAWEADLINTEYSTCLCCSVTSGVLDEESGRPARPGFAILLYNHGYFTSVSHLSVKALKRNT